jgi:O-antigen/teichoic acid export membrane protein
VAQLDKIVLTSVVSLREFGYYALAGIAANGLYVFVAPVFNAVFPRLVADMSTARLGTTYHRACQVASLLLLPPAVTVVVFAPEILSVWLGPAADIDTTGPLLQILAAATAVQGLLYVPNALMLGSGWTRLAIVVNFVGLVALVPMILILATRFGAIGAAVAWLAYNLAYALIGVPLMHRRLLRGDALQWYLLDVGAPLVGCVGPAILIRFSIGEPDTRFGMAVLILAAVVASAVGAALLTPLRGSIVSAIQQRWRRQMDQSVDS